MENPFAGLQVDTAPVERSEAEQRRLKRDAIYETYSPLVNEVLDELIAACAPGSWKKGSDVAHAYCCHVCWYAGPPEGFHAAYDEQHDIRRKIEITLEMDGACNPTGFKVIHHDYLHKCLHTGLSRAELVRGIQQVFG